MSCTISGYRHRPLYCNCRTQWGLLHSLVPEAVLSAYGLSANNVNTQQAPEGIGLGNGLLSEKAKMITSISTGLPVRYVLLGKATTQTCVVAQPLGAYTTHRPRLRQWRSHHSAYFFLVKVPAHHSLNGTISSIRSLDLVL